MSATINPAIAAAINPIQGFCVKTVTAAAVKAPASIIPSSAILITPPRSEYIPPSAASISGVESLIIEASNDRLMTVLILFTVLHSSPDQPLCAAAKD